MAVVFQPLWILRDLWGCPGQVIVGGGGEGVAGQGSFQAPSKLISIYLHLFYLWGSHIKEGSIADLGWGRGVHVARAFLLPSGK